MRVIRAASSHRQIADSGQRAARLGAAAIVVLALAVAATEYTGAVRALNNRAAHNAGQTETDRMLEIATTLGIAREFVLTALRLPDDATYTVATGPNVRVDTPLVHSALAGYLENLLLPRTRSRDEAEWLLCYGCELPPGRLDVVWRRDGMVVARVLR